tara:strand:+ start:551 stop:784 length:234 start_codon:yes stop_codon:yes gene_type:complete
MKIGELVVWKECIRGEQTDSFRETVGMLTRILNVDVDGYNILEIKTFQGETILAPGYECYSWSCPTNPGCHCGACHP